MLDYFSDDAREVVALAREDARSLNHNYVGTEHLLLGLLRNGRKPAANALAASGVDIEAARRRVEETAGARAPVELAPLTPRAKKVLELSVQGAPLSGQKQVEPGHILLQIVRDKESTAFGVLANLGIDLEQLELGASDLVAH